MTQTLTDARKPKVFLPPILWPQYNTTQCKPLERLYCAADASFGFLFFPNSFLPLERNPHKCGIEIRVPNSTDREWNSYSSIKFRPLFDSFFRSTNRLFRLRKCIISFSIPSFASFPPDGKITVWPLRFVSRLGRCRRNGCGKLHFKNHFRCIWYPAMKLSDVKREKGPRHSLNLRNLKSGL